MKFFKDKIVEKLNWSNQELASVQLEPWKA